MTWPGNVFRGLACQKAFPASTAIDLPTRRYSGSSENHGVQAPPVSGLMGHDYAYQLHFAIGLASHVEVLARVYGKGWLSLKLTSRHGKS